jgi:hypothetical protein
VEGALCRIGLQPIVLLLFGFALLAASASPSTYGQSTRPRLCGIIDPLDALLHCDEQCYGKAASRRTLQRWRKQGVIGYVMIGRKIGYRPAQVREFLDRQEHAGAPCPSSGR